MNSSIPGISPDTIGGQTSTTPLTNNSLANTIVCNCSLLGLTRYVVDNLGQDQAIKYLNLLNGIPDKIFQQALTEFKKFFESLANDGNSSATQLLNSVCTSTSSSPRRSTCIKQICCLMTPITDQMITFHISPDFFKYLPGTTPASMTNIIKLENSYENEINVFTAAVQKESSKLKTLTTRGVAE